ncbi:MAG: sigma-70 family RNA polymerase sigma factor [Planctomycetes bacterium]|nr:sigma-70 family RNA polymerase sigma factor [Planctomycetota bacterium]
MMPDWEQIVDAHARLVFGVAFRIVGQTHDAEDVAQETFREAFELAAAGRVTDWRGCLCRIATFRAIDLVRRRRKFGPLDGVPPSAVDEPLAKLEARELSDRLQAAVSELPRQPAAVFALTYFENLSRDEIAAALETTPGAVSVALFKARKQLQQILQLDPLQKEVYHEP